MPEGWWNGERAGEMGASRWVGAKKIPLFGELYKSLEVVIKTGPKIFMQE